MIMFRAHFDGSVLVPDEPVDLPRDCQVSVSVTDAPSEYTVTEQDQPLLRLARALAQHPANLERPADLAEQHDHYLYGTSKRY